MAVRRMDLPLSVSSNFDSGNIICDAIIPNEGAEPATIVNLRIKPEPFTEGTDNKTHSQWFHFRVSNGPPSRCIFRITNAGTTSYPDAWKNYHTCASFDRKTWFRCQDTTYEAGVLSWPFLFPEGTSTCWFAYFAPYTYEQHQSLIGRCVATSYARLASLGDTLDGRPIDMLIVSQEASTGGTVWRPNIWITARQHPGESMAEWCVEGFLERLLSPDDALAKKLRTSANFFVIPNANPDGSIRGHLRTNAKGANLNREWAATGDHQAPTEANSPEIFFILKALDKIGCDGFLDVHGDEEIEGNFLAGEQGCPNWNDTLQGLFDTFRNALFRANPDFQLQKGYDQDAPGTANLAICSAQITHRFGCFAATLEQPFKDTADEYPQPISGWNPERSRRLGATLLDAWADVLPGIRLNHMGKPAA
eukprot:CAMPEP_0114549984 /NCGR_PEP_ID=MMETSP0114-20121206/5822_1 /TAXON_ID=31324 /ORGANISM="Goniomonas sp, Strain m" /LENGTH=420 /DNA_ID=CAMNT_0001734709 /DNA_START=22 /DNA_END=1284 /DNA_ORIENTATION=+